MKKVPPQQAKKRPKPTASLSLFDVIEAELAAVGSGGTPSGTAAPGATGENVVDGAGKQKAGTMAPSLRNLAPSSGPAKLAFPNDRHVADNAKHRGFQREVPRPKKLTATKKSVLAQRAATGKNSIPDENTDVSVSSHEVEPVNDQVLTAAEDLHSPSIDVAERTLVVAPNDGRPQAQKAVTDRVKSPLPDSSSTGDLHANTRQIASKAWDGINKSLKILQLGQAPLVPPPIEVGENLSDHDDSSGEQHVEEIQLTTKRRRRRKKKAATLGQEQGRQTTLNQWNYCTQLSSDDQDALITILLDKLVQFQTRTRNLNPIKTNLLQAKAKRRIVLGMREVLRHSARGKLKAVIIAKNVEPSSGPAGTTTFLNSLLDACYYNNIPVVFAMTRRQLAGAIVHTHEVAVTCVGILSYEGAEEHFNAVLQRSNELNRAWIDLFACDAYHVHDAQEHRLWYACREGYRQFEIVQQCVAHGWDPNFVDSANGENPLMIAIKTGHAVVAISLLKLGVVDVTARNFLGQTAFHLACEKGQAGTLAALLSSLNRDPSASAEDESNLQHLLAEKSFAGLTPLAYAVHGTHVECVETLLKWASTRDWIDRVGLNVKDSQGMTPVAKASALGAAQVLDLFLRHVVDPHHLSTPLIVAAKFGQESVIRLLLSRLDSLLQSSKVDGLSRPMSKKLLLEDQSRKLAILNAKGDDGKNALDWALLGDHDACARVLIEKGALASMDSATPADVASKE